ncbi:MAG: (2Fe-2S) ferredoxin domain-containing protein [Bacteroidia bacterium]|nr:(2Fe-2S) ferredoxin domain-containing protein [Bacteroidia bacterium]MCZ2276450.1 (2Fe-2S) ferredoxin domain-containing protein [Bacteroidia bacterium]
MKYKHHVFVCMNERVNSDRPSCGKERGMALVQEFKRQIKEAGLNHKIRAQYTGCLDACDYGPSAVVYPDGVFYGKLTPEDVSEIVQKHLIGGKPVSRLVIRFDTDHA